jgi:hypothetical protein
MVLVHGVDNKKIFLDTRLFDALNSTLKYLVLLRIVVLRFTKQNCRLFLEAFTRATRWNAAFLVMRRASLLAHRRMKRSHLSWSTRMTHRATVTLW